MMLLSAVVKNNQGLILFGTVFIVFLGEIEGSEQNPCKIGKIPCDDGECISRWDWCNNKVECTDHSDEKYCNIGLFGEYVNNNCADKHYVCNDGMCFPASVRCDREWDCTGYEDEENCEYLDEVQFPLTPFQESTREIYTTILPTPRESDKRNKSDIKSITGLISAERNLTEHLLRTRRQEAHSINKWGTYARRIAVALFLNDQRFFALGNRTGEEIAYELSLQLSSKLALKRKIPTKDLALYINALTVACVNTKDFFGVNLVAELRKRVNNSNYTNPFSILTLCNAKDTMTLDDVNKLKQQYDAQFRPVWTDTQAMVVMALSCIHTRTDLNFDENILDNMISDLKSKQHKNGTIDNLKSTALVVQALLAAGKYRTDFDLSAAMKFILAEVGRRHPSPHEIYYILPIFNSMSLANITSNHCVTSIKSDPEVISHFREHSNERIQVQISVIVGDGMDFSRIWKVKVPSNYTFYHVLERIGSLEPAYKVQYSVSEGKPYVVSLAKFQDDTEDGLFWFTYTKPLASTGNPKLIEQSPVDIQVKESEELILWYRSGPWANTQEILSR